MRLLTSRDSDFSLYFDKINESEAGTNNLLLKYMLNDNLNVAVSKRKKKGVLSLEIFLAFSRHSKNK